MHLNPLTGMMNITTTGLHTCHHPPGGEAEEGGEVTLTPLTTTAMKTIMITTDMTTTTTGAAMTTLTMATTTSRGPGEAEEEGVGSEVVPLRPGAVELSHQGADWVSPSEGDLEQAEVRVNFSVFSKVWGGGSISHTGFQQ